MGTEALPFLLCSRRHPEKGVEKEAGVTSLAGLPGGRKMQEMMENSLQSWRVERKTERRKDARTSLSSMDHCNGC